MGFLELKGLTKRYGTAAVVKDVSLSVEKGQLCACWGLGCGKTTTLRLIAGFVEPDEGEISVGGRRASPRPAPARRPSAATCR